MFDFTDPNNQPWDELINHLTGIEIEVPPVDLAWLALRHKFSDLTGVTIQTGGNTVGTEEGRMIRLAMKELGYERENKCVDHGWNVRYGKDGKWSKWMSIPFGNSPEPEYRVAIAGLEAQ